MRRILALTGATLVVACSDSTSPPAADSPTTEPPTASQVFAHFVALGTSNSMGVQSAGIFAAGQEAAWPAQLAARAGVPVSLPLLEDPGCGPPLLAPLAADFALVGAFAALGAGEDLVSAVATTCASLRAGVTLPTSNVAISGADVHDALHSTVESKMAFSSRVGTLYSRVLPPGQTQVTAMLAQQPTFVSVELAANDVLPASTGVVAAMTPYDDWARDFDEVLAAVRSTGARAVLVGLPTSSAAFPSVRSASEFFDEAGTLAALGITVSDDCASSENQLFIPGYVLTLLAQAPATATCADVPGVVDYVLTPGDIAAIDERMALINAYIQARASESGYAYFALSSLYDLPKPPFDMRDVLFSSTPFGANISLDGVHPSTQGQGILTDAAVEAIDARYGLAIP